MEFGYGKYNSFYYPVHIENKRMVFTDGIRKLVCTRFRVICIMYANKLRSHVLNLKEALIYISLFTHIEYCSPSICEY